MHKLYNIYRAGWKLGIKIFGAYLKRKLRYPVSEGELALIAYYNILIDCNCFNLYAEKKGFVFRNKANTAFFGRAYPSSDLRVFAQIWKEEEYKEIVSFLKKNIREKRLRVIDAGANVGYTTLYLNETLSSEFEISFLCIEPSNDNAEILHKNVSLNKISKAAIEIAGLFNKTAYLRITTGFRDGKDWSLQIEESETPTNLKSVEILQLIKKYEWDIIDFLKIDIEGAERYLFSDADYAGMFLQKVRVIAIEIHDEYLIRNQIVRILEENNFKLSESGEITVGINKNLIYNGLVVGNTVL